MLKTVADLEDSVGGLVTGVDLSNVNNLFGCFERAARTLVQKADIPEASGIQNVTLYSGVFDYLCDPRIFATSITDIRPQGISRNYNDDVTKTNQQDFDRSKGYYPSGTTSAFEFRNGVPIIRITAPFPVQKIILSPMNSAVGWTAGGDASGIFTDNTFFYQYPGSIRYNLAAAGSQGTISSTLESPIDMSAYIGIGLCFLAVEMPDASAITSYTLRIGSDSSNYYSMTATSQFLGAFVSGEFQLIGFDLQNATITGSPVDTAIQYVEVLVNYNGAAQQNMRIGYLFASLPSPAQILYQSAAIYLPVGSTTPLTTITAITDTIILNDAAFTIYEHESAISVLQQSGNSGASASILGLSGVLNGQRARNGTVINAGLYDLYRGDNPSQQLRQSGSWYDNSSSYSNNQY